METIPLEVLKVKNKDNSETIRFINIESLADSSYKEWLKPIKIFPRLLSNTSSSIIDCSIKGWSSDVAKWVSYDEENEEYNNLIPALSGWNTNTITHMYKCFFDESIKQNIYQDFENFLNVLVADIGIRDVCKNFVLKNFVDINRLLTKENYLINELKNIYEQIDKYYGKSLEDVFLKYIKDPEEDFEGLSIIVRSKLPFDEAFKSISKFYKEYWFNLSIEIKNVINVTIDKE